MPESKSPESKSGGGSSLAQKVVDKAMEYVNRGNPYCWGGKGESLTDANVSKLSSWYPDATNKGWYKHLQPGGHSYSKVNQSGMECVDCSGLTHKVFEEVAGIDIGHGTGSQIGFKQQDIGYANAQPGDLLVNSNHAAIMGTGGMMIEAKGKDYGCTHDRAPKSNMKAMRVVDGGSSVTSSSTTASSGGATASGGGSLLTQAQINSAIKYNRNNSQDICLKIQAMVGVEQDNSFGPITVGAIAKWQQSKGLEVDGCFGPQSRATAEAAGWSATTAAPATTTTTTPAPAPATPAPAPATTTATTTPAPAPAATTTTTAVPSHKLSKSEINTAVSYNRNNNQSICIKIQALVGVEQDNSFGPITVQAIADWQASKGLEVDGCFGPQSKKAAGFTTDASSSAPAAPAAPAAPETKPEETKPEDTTPVTVDADDYTGTEEVRYGQSNNKVRTLQKLLNKHNAGRYGNSIGVDGDFGKGTATALMRFQYFYVKGTNVCQFFKDCLNNGKKAVCDAETWAKLRIASPNYTHDKNKAIPYSKGVELDSSMTPDTPIYSAYDKPCGKMSAAGAPKFNAMAKASLGSSQPISGVASSFRGMTDEATVAATGGVGGSEGAIELYVDRGFNTASAAAPGYSNHCGGNAVDISGFSSRTDKPSLWYWLNSNASTYSFHPYDYETWHWNFY